MVEKKEDIPKISLSNTKKEMLEAFNLLKEKFKEKSKAELMPEKVKEAKKEKEVTYIADKVASESAIKRISELKLELGNALSIISGKLEEENEKYNKIKEAINLKNKELNEIFEIENSAYALAALLEAQKQKKLEFEYEMQQRKISLVEEIDKKRADWEKEKRQYYDLLKEQKVEGEKLKKREKEEYEYQFNRDKDHKKQKLKDEIDHLTKELEAKKEAFEKQISEKENDLLQRDLAVSEREKAMADLQKRVDAFPLELESSINKAVQEARKAATADAQKNEELNIKGFQGEKNVLVTKIESLEKIVADQRKQLDTLSEQLENAYEKVQDIAVKAVSSSQIHNMPAPDHRPSYKEQDKS